MVRGAMDLLTSGELGVAAVTVCEHPEFKTGSVLLELLYVAECAAPTVLQAERFMPPSVQRVLLDMQGKDRAAEIPHDKLRGFCLTRNRKLADTVIRSQTPLFKQLIEHADGLAQDKLQALIDTARERMQQELGAELGRLSALAEVNPNVRQDEIEQLAARRDLLEIHLNDTRVRLDAVRAVVMR